LNNPLDEFEVVTSNELIVGSLGANGEHAAIPSIWHAADTKYAFSVMGSLDLSRNDLQRLIFPYWLNDEGMNFSLQLITNSQQSNIDVLSALASAEVTSAQFDLLQAEGVLYHAFEAAQPGHSPEEFEYYTLSDGQRLAIPKERISELEEADKARSALAAAKDAAITAAAPPYAIMNTFFLSKLDGNFSELSRCASALFLTIEL
jgi:hypothetical protein